MDNIKYRKPLNTKKEARKDCTLKDSFWNSIEYVTYRQEKDEELLKFLVLFLTSTASVDTDAIISYELLVCFANVML